MNLYIPVFVLVLAFLALAAAAYLWHRNPRARVRFYHRLMRWGARKHYLATRQAAEADLAEINRHVNAGEP